MKTLIFNGSPRKNGDTVSLIREMTENLHGETRIVNTYFCKIHACIDCRYCVKNNGCSIHDEMQDIYDYIQDCDNILIASPIYFSELTGPLLSVGSRLQPYFRARFFRNETPILKSKKGAVILTGGNGVYEKPYETACILLKHMNAQNILPAVGSFDTNNLPAKEDANATQGAKKIAEYFNGNP